MTTTERRDELATIRLLGGTAGHATRMVTLEMLPTVIAALGAGSGNRRCRSRRRTPRRDGLPARRVVAAHRWARGRRGHPRTPRCRGDHTTGVAGVAHGGDARQGVNAGTTVMLEAAQRGPPLQPEPCSSACSCSSACRCLGSEPELTPRQREAAVAPQLKCGAGDAVGLATAMRRRSPRSVKPVVAAHPKRTIRDDTRRSCCCWQAGVQVHAGETVAWDDEQRESRAALASRLLQWQSDSAAKLITHACSRVVPALRGCVPASPAAAGPQPSAPSHEDRQPAARAATAPYRPRCK